MDDNIIVESLPQLGMCNLCLTEGAVKSMLISHDINGQAEKYSEMLQKCFAIDISLLELGDSKHLICDTCTVRLRDCTLFKHQIEQALATLESAWKMQKGAFDPGPIDVSTYVSPSVSDTSIVKKELEAIGFYDAPGDDHIGDDDDDDDDNADGDYIPDFKIKNRIKKESVEKEKKPKHAQKRFSRISAQDLKETESMLDCGLFPFKIRKNRAICCAICPESSTVLDEIRTHIVQHTKKNIHIALNKMVYSDSYRFYKCSTKLRCKICTADIEDFEALKEHIENCTRLKFKQKWNHLPFKLEKDQLDCPVCKKRFLNFVNLNTHMNVHYPNYICENCGKAFASKARLRGHMRTHEEGQFPCKYCNAIFDRVTKRENHISKEHKSGVRYACKRCNITLSSFYARQKHLAEVHNEELKRYKCKACPQSYITPGHLSSHVRRDHLNERNHKCHKCDLAFYTKNALKMHMIKHDGERIHVCKVCEKSYQRKKTLREHMRIHDNDKRFVCPICGRAFTQKCTLKGHLRVHDRKIEFDDDAKPLAV